MFLDPSPYSLAEQEIREILEEVGKVRERAQLLRDAGPLNRDTLDLYYTRTKFEQVAESNAIEGNTLDVGETQRAIQAGTTLLAGHDPQHVRDARALYRAIEQLRVMAETRWPPDLLVAMEIDEIILDGRMGSGEIRRQPVRLKGQKHIPPKTYEQVLSQMEKWESWSRTASAEEPIVRAVVLHAWLTHIHPFVDGNGRTARAITTLEYVRAGLPPPIIRRNKDRTRYLDALAESDAGGDLSGLFELYLERTRHALTRLERAAAEGQGFDAVAAKLRQAQSRQAEIWSYAAELLLSHVADRLTAEAELLGGTASIERFEDELDVESYLMLIAGDPAGNSWLARFFVEIPALPPVRRLAWIGFRRPGAPGMPADDPGGPTIYWSAPNPDGYPPWQSLPPRESPGGGWLALVGDDWWISDGQTCIWRAPVTKTGDRLARGLLEAAASA